MDKCFRDDIEENKLSRITELNREMEWEEEKWDIQLQKLMARWQACIKTVFFLLSSKLDFSENYTLVSSYSHSPIPGFSRGPFGKVPFNRS